MVRIVFFPAAFIWVRMLTDKAVSNTQEERYEYLTSFLNTKLNTLTIQTTSPPFYYHIVKCSRTKCVPADTRGTNQWRVLGEHAVNRAQVLIFLSGQQILWFSSSDLIFFLISSSDLCVERSYRQRKTSSAGFKYNSNMKNKGANSRRQGLLFYKLSQATFQAGTRSHREASSIVLLNELANKISSHLTVISMRRSWKPTPFTHNTA